MYYWLLALAIGVTLGYNALLHGVRCSGFRSTLRFNALLALASSLSALFLYGFAAAPARSTLVCGVAFGIMITVNLYSRAMALRLGPLSPTLLIGCSSMIVQTLVGSLLWHEPVAVHQGIGVCLMAVAMFFSLKPDRSGSYSKKWLFYALLLFLTNGTTGLIFKAHQSTDGADQYLLFLATGYALGAGLMYLLSVFQPKASENEVDRKRILRGVIGGVLLCGTNALTTVLAGALPSILFFPVYNGLVIVFSLPAAMLLFHEKATKLQMTSLIMAVAAILFLGNVIRIG